MTAFSLVMLGNWFFLLFFVVVSLCLNPVSFLFFFPSSFVYFVK